MTPDGAEPIPKPIRQQAATWFAERESGAMSGEDEARFAAWLAASDLHARAFEQVERVWRSLDAPMLEAPIVEATPSSAPARRRFRRWAATPAPHRRRRAAAAVAVASVAFAFFFGADMPVRLQANAMTATGERRAVTLPDGSVALLNTDSAIAFDGAGRHVRLLKGEAAFQVAPDPRHPFEVAAADGTTTALGTRFIVRRGGDATRVTVTEHSVRVATDGHALIVAEGDSAAYGAGDLGRRPDVSVAEADAWTRGRIRVIDRPLGQVVAELARYHRGYILVSDAIADRPVSGTFDIGDPIGAIDVIQRTLGISSTRLTDRLILLHG